MDFIKLVGTVIAVWFHPGSASKFHGERICRLGTERPCYKAFYIQDTRRRVTFEDATQACRMDGGELLSIETESEQRLMETFITQLHVGDGDFWIGLYRSLQHPRRGSTTSTCPSQYYWLDGSKTKYRNWHWDEPSCGKERCVVLYYQRSRPFEDSRFPFQWMDDNCSSKNNFICKYQEEKLPLFTAPSPKPNVVPTTEEDENMRIVHGSSVSFSDNSLNVSYILCATIPALLLLLFAVTGFLCYKQHGKRRKTETKNFSGRSKQGTTTIASPCPVQGPYAFSDITRLPHTVLDGRMTAKRTEYSCSPSLNSLCDDYENVTSVDRESGFVSNDIYESCRAQSQQCHSQTGWVENEIYG
ncbi:chondrolectin isoform X1 [Oryzias latipes]|uniref:chondrolectin isoform X1 n=1 Tax=Oryzias latipes TaxID=8090 RepID=UPI0002A49171|nr:chondrolectin isoform X1 [Oryzias latipes]XP_020563936.1 chondrolectin isoform X1 [Oryzias latipes]